MSIGQLPAIDLGHTPAIDARIGPRVRAKGASTGAATADPRLVAPSIFWFWNADVTLDSVRRRLDAFLSRGIRSVYIHPMPDDFRPEDFHGGMITEYLSPEFFDLVALTCEEMRQRDMTLWLYDEGGWPSGRAGGQLVLEDRAFAARGLRQLHGRHIEVDFLHECDYPDLMNIEATRRFIDLTHERYRGAVGSEFGRTIRGIFTDEPRILGRLGTQTIPWSPTLPAAFEAEHGYPLDGVLPRLFHTDHIDDATWRARRDYLSTISNQISRSYFEPIRAWCERFGLLFEGHHTGDNDFARHGEYHGNYLDQAQRYHIPGVDAIWRQVFPGQPGGNYVSLAASSAWLAGRHVASSELFAVYGQGLTLGQMRWISAHHLVRGVNRHGLMASLESNQGARRLGVCSDFSPDDPRWQDLDVYINYVTRASNFTLRGTPVTPVAMFYRIEQLTGAEADAFNALHDRVSDRVLDGLHPLLFAGANQLVRACEMGVTDLVVLPSAPLERRERDALAAAEARGIRVQYVSEADEVRLPASPLIQPLTPAQDVRALPLRHKGEATVDLMLFNEGGAAQELQFRWLGQPLKEHRFEDDPTMDFRPLRHHDGVCQVTLLPGELRAWEASGNWEQTPDWVELSAEAIVDGWTMQTSARLSIADRPVLEQVATPAQAVRLDDEAILHQPFSGTRVYRTTLRVAVHAGRRYILDLGGIYDACEVALDGRTVARRAWAPWQVDLTSALQAGGRELEVRVTNTAASGWLEPCVHQRDAREWPSTYLNIAAPFMRESNRAGLAGPVWLRVFVCND